MRQLACFIAARWKIRPEIVALGPFEALSYKSYRFQSSGRTVMMKVILGELNKTVQNIPLGFIQTVRCYQTVPFALPFDKSPQQT